MNLCRTLCSFRISPPSTAAGAILSHGCGSIASCDWEYYSALLVLCNTAVLHFRPVGTFRPPHSRTSYSWRSQMLCVTQII